MKLYELCNLAGEIFHFILVLQVTCFYFLNFVTRFYLRIHFWESRLKVGCKTHMGEVLKVEPARFLP